MLTERDAEYKNLTSDVTNEVNSKGPKKKAGGQKVRISFNCFATNVLLIKNGSGELIKKCCETCVRETALLINSARAN